MFCNNCGSKLGANMKFCNNCGAAAAVSQLSPPPQEPVYTPPPPYAPPPQAYAPPPPQQYALPPTQYAPPADVSTQKKPFPLFLKIVIPVAAVVVAGAVFLGLFFFTDLFSPSTDRNGATVSDREVDRNKDSNANAGDSSGGNESPSPSPSTSPTSPSPPPPRDPMFEPGLGREGGRVIITEETKLEFTPGESGFWELRTSDNDDCDPQLTLLDSNGTQITYDDDGGGGFNALIIIYLDAGHTYTVVAGFYEFDDRTGSYTLTVSPGTEPSSDPSQLFEGSIRVYEGMEFTFCPTATGVWEFVTSDNGRSDPYLDIYGPYGYIDGDDDGGDGLNSYLSVLLEMGVEYTLVAGFIGGMTDSYVLTVSYGAGSAIMPGGAIRDEVYFNGIPISHILESHPEYTLGAPVRTDGPNQFYDGIDLYFDGTYVHSVHSEEPGLFEVYEITLDRTRTQLIAALGDPLEYYQYPESPDYPYRASDDDRRMRYHVSTYVIDYILDFWFSGDDGELVETIAFMPLVPRY